MPENGTQQILDNSLQFSADLSFLALTVWREARGQSEECQMAVAYSILNRVHRPSWWGNDIASVVFKRLQYSSLTYKNDPQLTTWPEHSQDPAWKQCLRVASQAMHGIVPNPAAGCDSYFDISIAAPAWAKPEQFVVQIGRIKFYDTDNDHERPA